MKGKNYTTQFDYIQRNALLSTEKVGNLYSGKYVKFNHRFLFSPHLPRNTLKLLTVT